MGIELKRPFSEYVAIDELPATGDAKKFVAHFVFQLEGTTKTETRSIEWSYSGTAQAIDQKNGVDGLRGRRQRALQQLERSVSAELDEIDDRVYDSPESKIPIRGKKR